MKNSLAFFLQKPRPCANGKRGGARGSRGFPQHPVGDAMVWCADHGTYAQEICETIYESLTIDETPLHKKIARVYLICDILTNCAQRGVRDIFFYRTCFEQLMTKIFEALGDTLRNIEARLKAEHFKQRIMLCFRAWEDNAIYPTEFLIHNQNVFLGLVKRSDEHFQSESENGGDDEDIDGAPIDDDIDGVPLSEDMLEPTTTLFGSKIVDPVISQHEKKGGFKSAGWNDVTEEVKKPTSKWENDGRDSDEERAGTAKRFKMDGKSADKPGSSSDSEGEIQETDPNAAQAAAHYEEVRRRMLREVEVKVMSYQDDLESARDPDIKNKVEEFRKKEMNVMELKLRSARTVEEIEVGIRTESGKEVVPEVVVEIEVVVLIEAEVIETGIGTETEIETVGNEDIRQLEDTSGVEKGHLSGDVVERHEAFKLGCLAAVAWLAVIVI